MTPDDATRAILDHVRGGSPYGPADELNADWSVPPAARNTYLASEAVPSEPDIWATLFVRHSGRSRIGFPGRSWRVFGVVEISVNIPLGMGTYTVHGITGELIRRLDAKRLPGGVDLTGSSVHDLSPDPDFPYRTARVEARFQYTDDGR